jgi:hypothetical protein
VQPGNTFATVVHCLLTGLTDWRLNPSPSSGITPGGRADGWNETSLRMRPVLTDARDVSLGTVTA